MSSKKFNKSNQKKPAPVENSRATSYGGRSPAFVWFVRIIVVLLCVAVAVTLIPSVFF